jgi:hypothetical protein
MRTLEQRYSAISRALSAEGEKLLDVLVRASKHGTELEQAGKTPEEIAQAVAAIIKEEAPQLPVIVTNGVVRVRFGNQDLETPIYPIKPRASAEPKPIHFA